MRVCDSCQQPSSKHVRVKFEKLVAKKYQDIINIPMDLCDSCLTNAMKNFGRLKFTKELFNTFIEKGKEKPVEAPP